MKTKTYPVKTYDTNISGNNQHNKKAAEYASIFKPEVQDFEDLLATSTDAYLDAYESNNLDQLKELLNSQRSIRKELTIQLRNYPDQTRDFVRFMYPFLHEPDSTSHLLFITQAAFYFTGNY